ncbi:LPS export ABC transporter periplasmic protein LptC [Xylophilus sp.]|uniref:LPS export ABC transporter periplasmic protein LptC n=1 Tax=Xylophilus sp. TaxID=2653893 RepID=UPI0013BC9A32|nr:LPS export ABC transporter periplasmic protein LptC [Xylophilus sp.]KAF1045910.1 MAG: Lipopolysaccharide export system protein LptC [Xylophilus sp.]
MTTAAQRQRPALPALARLCVRVALDRVSLYLPVVLMGLLALGTYWLVRSTPAPAQAQPERPVRHEPDYFMHDFSVKNFEVGGRLKSEVRGVDGRHFPDTDTLEIDQAHITSYADDGRRTVATANRALSNGDGSEVQLFGNAVVVREAGPNAKGDPQPRMEFRGEFLHVFVNTEQVRSNKPVTLIRGSDQFTADSLDYDNLGQVAQLQGRVKGVMVPGAGVTPTPR